MVTKEEKRELERIRKQNNQPKDEEKTVPITKNGIQFKISIPKKFARFINLDGNKNKAKFTFNKRENKIYMEVIDA